MFDIGIDKLMVVGVLVGLIAGPERLLSWSRTVMHGIGRMRAAYQQGKVSVVSELNELAPEWRDYDPRRLHPRRILREALEGADPVPPEAVLTDPDRPDAEHATTDLPALLAAALPGSAIPLPTARSTPTTVPAQPQPQPQPPVLAQLQAQEQTPVQVAAQAPVRAHVSLPAQAQVVVPAEPSAPVPVSGRGFAQPHPSSRATGAVHPADPVHSSGVAAPLPPAAPVAIEDPVPVPLTRRELSRRRALLAQAAAEEGA